VVLLSTLIWIGYVEYAKPLSLKIFTFPSFFNHLFIHMKQ